MENNNKLFGDNHLVSTTNIITSMDKGDIKKLFKVMISNLGIHYIAVASGIDFKTLVRYEADIFKHLNKEDTERLLEVINEMYLPEKLHKGLEYYPMIKCVEYEEQLEEYKKAREKQRTRTLGAVK